MGEWVERKDRDYIIGTPGTIFPDHSRPTTVNANGRMKKIQQNRWGLFDKNRQQPPDILSKSMVMCFISNELVQQNRFEIYWLV